MNSVVQHFLLFQKESDIFIRSTKRFLSTCFAPVFPALIRPCFPPERIHSRVYKTSFDSLRRPQPVLIFFHPLRLHTHLHHTPSPAATSPLSSPTTSPPHSPPWPFSSAATPSPISPFPVVPLSCRVTLIPIDHVATAPLTDLFHRDRRGPCRERDSPGRGHGTTPIGLRRTRGVRLDQLSATPPTHRPRLL